jgi:hypothetical protein
MTARLSAQGLAFRGASARTLSHTSLVVPGATGRLVP